jgi:hypothetical protein
MKNSKKYIILLCLLGFTLVVDAQTTISYSYFNSGSRKHRGITVKSFIETDSIFINALAQNTTVLESQTPKTDNTEPIKTATNASMNVFPIPTTGKVNIELTGYPSGFFALYSIDGLLLRSDQLNSGLNTLNLEEVVDGTFILVVKSGTVVQNWKVIKQ